MVYDVVKAVVEVFDVLVYVKLIFSVIDIVIVVKAVEDVGVSGLIMINILVGMCFDFKIRKLILVNGIGGMFGLVVFLVVFKFIC